MTFNVVVITINVRHLDGYCNKHLIRLIMARIFENAVKFNKCFNAF